MIGFSWTNGFRILIWLLWTMFHDTSEAQSTHGVGVCDSSSSLLSETNFSLLLVSEYDIAKKVGIIAIHVLENIFGKKDRASIPV